MLSKKSGIENLFDEAQVLENQKCYDAAVEKLKCILRILESTSDITCQVSTLKKLGEIYQQMSREQYERALAIMGHCQQFPLTGDLGGGSSGNPFPIEREPAKTADGGSGSGGTPPISV